MSKEDNEVTVIGIDPAPGKDSVVFDGQLPPQKLDANCLDKFLGGLRNDEDNKKVLICWDAPLTGPRSLKPDYDLQKGDLTQRSIETFFRSKKCCGEKLPGGISVRGYAGCPHWTISRRLLGLPIIGKYDCRDLPFGLLHDKPTKWSEPYIVEVHPALAIWLWLKDTGSIKTNEWYYKGLSPKASKKEKDHKAEILFDRRHKMYGGIVDIACKLGFENIEEHGLPNKEQLTDDHLDAFVAWLLGKLWVSTEGDEGDVRILGNKNTGSFLLPYHGDVFGKWKDYCSKQKKRICPNEKA